MMSKAQGINSYIFRGRQRTVRAMEKREQVQPQQPDC